MDLGNLLKQAVEEGRKVQKATKRGRPRKAKPAEKKAPAEPPRSPKEILKGTYSNHSVVASYTKRRCLRCGHEELLDIPTIFLLKKHIRVESSKIYERISQPQQVYHLLHSLPFKSELWVETSPGCKHCLARTISHVKESKRHSSPVRANPPRPDAEVSICTSRALQRSCEYPKPGVSSWCFGEVHDSANQGGS